MYKEIEKIKRVSDSGFENTTLICKDNSIDRFAHFCDQKVMRDGAFTGQTELKSMLKVEKREYSAGISVSVTKVDRAGRYHEHSVELGKSEIDLLKTFLNSVEDREYTGTFVDAPLENIQ